MLPKHSLPLGLSALALLAPSAGRAQDARPRRLLVFAPSRDDARFRRQDALLARAQAAFRDRDLVRTDVIGGGPDAARLRARYRVRPGGFRVVLVGRDGHVAYAGPSPVPPGEITGRIDAMPMRRQEMRQRGHRLL